MVSLHHLSVLARGLGFQLDLPAIEQLRDLFGRKSFLTIDDVPFLDGGVPLEIDVPFAIGISGDTLYVASNADGSITACDSTWPCRTNESIGLIDPVAMAISGTDGALDRRSP